MTARGELLGLAQELEDHLARVASVVQTTAELAAGEPPPLAETWAVAAHLHAFYTGCEAILLRAVEPFDGPPPPGPTSHARLLQRCSLAVRGLRPAVVSPATARSLDRYRAFRHFFRHAYGVTLEWSLMEEKVQALEDVHAHVVADVLAYVAFLRSGSADEGDEPSPAPEH